MTVLISIGVYVFSSIALGKIFVKLGEQAWKGWVPIVNTVTLFELGRYSAVWVVGLFIPVANLVALVVFILAVNNVNRRLGRGGGFTLLHLVCLPVWAGVLGFGKCADTGWMPATGYVPFAPVTPLSVTPRSMAPLSVPPTSVPPLSVPPTSVPPLSVPPTSVPPEPVPSERAPAPAAVAPTAVAPTAVAPAAVPADHKATVPAPTAPPAPLVTSEPPPPLTRVPPVAPPGAQALPTGPPPFYVGAPPARRVAEAPPAQSAPPTGSAPPAHAAAAAVPPELAPAPVAATPPAEADDDLDETMIVVRHMKPWTLETEHGLKVSLTKSAVLLGRNPARGSAHPGAQLVVLHDPDKTVSKTHARLDYFEGIWGIRDLQSTNGTVLIDSGGNENELDAGASSALTDRFLLGELAARIYLEA